jgi:predicted regulator of Ras-like GTPase activity (Roadblock/LC7/MglB family)
MAFRDELTRVCESVEGGVLCTLMSFDGIPVDTFERPEQASRLNVATLLAEIASAANQLKGTLSGSGFRAPGELTVTLDDCSVILRSINDEYFVALALESAGNFGKGRYLLRVSAPRIGEEL